MESQKVNTQYKDRLFRLLFGNESAKDNILTLYNALHDTAYTNADDLTIFTLDDAVYIKMKNDVAFLVDSYLSLWEQQSSYNPNMPVRGLMYFGNLYDKYIEENERNIYGSALVKIPTPQYIVFYNGVREQDSVKKLRLSDAFMNPDDSGDFEWTATMYNLNKGKNDELLIKCKPLSDYMELVNRIRQNQKNGMIVEAAVDRAVDSCIEDGILSEFLIGHRAEVRDMCITEFNEKVFVNGIRAEGIQEGIQQGLQQGAQQARIEAVENMLRANIPEQTIRSMGYTEEELSSAKQNISVLV
jgi:hypothetical protein